MPEPVPASAMTPLAHRMKTPSPFMSEAAPPAPTPAPPSQPKQLLANPTIDKVLLSSGYSDHDVVDWMLTGTYYPAEQQK